MFLKKIIKKILIKLNRFNGYEIIDQNEFSFPSLKDKRFDDLSIINKKSIVLPLGEVKITRKVKSLGIIVRTNSNIHISDQNKKRIFNKEKISYIEKSLESLMISIKSLKSKYKQFEINLTIVDQSNDEKIYSVGSGTGFFINRSGHIVSNNHVIDSCNAVKLHYKGKVTPVTILATDRSNDLSLMKVETKPDDVFPVAIDDANLLDDVYVAGFL